jgi:hypothetical protein
MAGTASPLAAGAWANATAEKNIQTAKNSPGRECLLPNVRLERGIFIIFYPLAASWLIDMISD